MKSYDTNSQSGNVIFYIFVAVALLAALSFAISQGGRGSLKSLTDDRENLLATEIIDYADTIKKSVATLRLRGTQLSELSFAHGDAHANYGTYDNDADNEIFNPAGGAIIYQSASSDVQTTTTAYEFIAENEVDLINTTCAGAGCVDLMLVLPNVIQPICIKINDLIGVDNPSGTPPVDTELDITTRFAGTAGYSFTVGDDGGAAAIAGQNSACVDDQTNGNVFYQVLWPR